MQIKHPVERDPNNDGRQQKGEDELIRPKPFHD
jgi:hypothetical protein